MVADPLSSLWPILHYDGPEAARRFLVEVVGFREGVVVRDDGDDIVHAELRWPGGGVLLFGDTKHVDGVHAGLRAAALYLVTDDVDAVHRRVRDAGAEIVVAPHATEFGAGGPTYACTVQDTEANLLTFGTYRGAAYRASVSREPHVISDVVGRDPELGGPYREPAGESIARYGGRYPSDVGAAIDHVEAGEHRHRRVRRPWPGRASGIAPSPTRALRRPGRSHSSKPPSRRASYRR